MSEKVLYENNPAMFRNRPLLFVFLLFLTISTYGLGLLILIIWYIKVKTTKLKITDSRIEVRRGILKKDTSEIHMSDVRNIKSNQTFFQRIFGVGKVILSSAATGGVEIAVGGMKNPKKIKEMIRKYRHN